MIICVLAVVFAGTTVFPFTLDPETQEAVDRATAAIANCEFERARAVADSMMGRAPGDPLPLILKLSILGLHEMDIERNVHRDDFDRTFENALESIDVLEKSQGRTSYVLTLLGYAKATHASYYLRVKQYFPAIRTGLDAIDILKQAKQLDSTNTDADLFLGLYDCVRADLKRVLWMVLFWYPADRNRGIRLLEECSRKSRMSRHAAKLALADIYVNNKKFENAGQVISELENSFPHSRFVYWARVRYHLALKEYCEAARFSRMLSESYAGVPDGEYNAIFTGLNTADYLRECGEIGQSILLCRRLINLCNKVDGKEYAAVCRDIDRLLNRMQQHDRNTDK